MDAFTMALRKASTQVSTNLEKCAMLLHRLLAAVDLFPMGGLYAGHYAEQAIRRYWLLWMPLLHQQRLMCSDAYAAHMLVPPLDVQWAWYVHRLNPVQYVADCEAAFGPGGLHAADALQGLGFGVSQEGGAESCGCPSGSSGAGVSGCDGAHECGQHGQGCERTGGGEWQAQGGLELDDQELQRRYMLTRRVWEACYPAGPVHPPEHVLWPPAPPPRPPHRQEGLKSATPGASSPVAAPGKQAVDANGAVGSQDVVGAGTPGGGSGNTGGDTGGGGKPAVGSLAAVRAYVIEAMPRQGRFLHQMLRAPYSDPAFLSAGRTRYLRFLALAATRQPGAPMLVPMYDIDLMWHAHLALSAAYGADCTALMPPPKAPAAPEVAPTAAPRSTPSEEPSVVAVEVEAAPAAKPSAAQPAATMCPQSTRDAAVHAESMQAPSAETPVAADSAAEVSAEGGAGTQQAAARPAGQLMGHDDSLLGPALEDPFTATRKRYEAATGLMYNVAPSRRIPTAVAHPLVAPLWPLAAALADPSRTEPRSLGTATISTASSGAAGSDPRVDQAQQGDGRQPQAPASLPPPLPPAGTVLLHPRRVAKELEAVAARRRRTRGERRREGLWVQRRWRWKWPFRSGASCVASGGGGGGKPGGGGGGGGAGSRPPMLGSPDHLERSGAFALYALWCLARGLEAHAAASTHGARPGEAACPRDSVSQSSPLREGRSGGGTAPRGLLGSCLGAPRPRSDGREGDSGRGGPAVCPKAADAAIRHMTRQLLNLADPAHPTSPLLTCGHTLWRDLLPLPPPAHPSPPVTVSSQTATAPSPQSVEPTMVTTRTPGSDNDGQSHHLPVEGKDLSAAAAVQASSSTHAWFAVQRPCSAPPPAAPAASLPPSPGSQAPAAQHPPRAAHVALHPHTPMPSAPAVQPRHPHPPPRLDQRAGFAPAGARDADLVYLAPHHYAAPMPVLYTPADLCLLGAGRWCMPPALAEAEYGDLLYDDADDAYGGDTDGDRRHGGGGGGLDGCRGFRRDRNALGRLVHGADWERRLLQAYRVIHKELRARAEAGCRASGRRADGRQPCAAADGMHLAGGARQP